MKNYTNIPIKERIRNAKRCLRHEVTLEEREVKRLTKAKEQFYDEGETDKEREAQETYSRLKAIEESGGRYA